MATITRFEEIEAWKIARELTRDIYRITSSGAFAKDFGLCDQIRRAAVSIMSNIAEGFERDGNKEFCNFLSIAKASSGEVKSQLYIALDQNYISAEDFKAIYDRASENGRVTAGLINDLRQSDLKGIKFRH